jgi:hypothetical protein
VTVPAHASCRAQGACADELPRVGEVLSVISQVVADRDREREIERESARARGTRGRGIFPSARARLYRARGIFHRESARACAFVPRACSNAQAAHTHIRARPPPHTHERTHTRTHAARQKG